MNKIKKSGSFSKLASAIIHPSRSDSKDSSNRKNPDGDVDDEFPQLSELASKLEASVLGDTQPSDPGPSNQSTSFSNVLERVESAHKVKTQRIIDVMDKNIAWGPTQVGARTTQVIIDIDDTVKSSGGYKLFNVPLGGIDTQYGRGELYPGCFQFILELSIYKMESHMKPLLLSVLTTRIPQVPITVDSALNVRLRQVAEKRGILNWGIDCNNKILYSTLKEWVFNEARGEKKFVNFRKLLNFVDKENQDAMFIWIGDTGDRDLEAGEMMIKYFTDKIKAVFMHCVNPTQGTATGMPNDYYLHSVPILFFKTYVGAAKKAVEHGLLNHNALSRVLVRAVLELNENTTSDHSKWKDLIQDIMVSWDDAAGSRGNRKFEKVRRALRRQNEVDNRQQNQRAVQTARREQAEQKGLVVDCAENAAALRVQRI